MSEEQLTSSVDLAGVLERLDIIINQLESNDLAEAVRHSDQITEIKTIESDLKSFDERFELVENRVDVMYQASMWIILLLGLIAGILFVLVFSGGKKK